MRMAINDTRYAQIVGWLKVLLPLAALVLLSFMFMIARTIDPTEALRVGDLPAETARRQITGPSFSTVTEDGAAISFVARSARPLGQEPDAIAATDLDALLETPDGAQVKISAPEAELLGADQRLELAGGVRLETSTGYEIESPALEARLDATRLASKGPVKARGPLGELTAGAAEVTRQDGHDTYVLVFKDGVKLVYQPHGREER